MLGLQSGPPRSKETDAAVMPGRFERMGATPRTGPTVVARINAPSWQLCGVLCNPEAKPMADLATRPMMASEGYRPVQLMREKVRRADQRRPSATLHACTYACMHVQVANRCNTAVLEERQARHHACSHAPCMQHRAAMVRCSVCSVRRRAACTGSQVLP